MKLFSKSTTGFYDPEIHGDNIPNDAVEISDEYYVSLFEGQASGKQISANKQGHPILVDVTQSASYTVLRAAEYPPMQDYLDGVVKDDQAQIDKYIADCKAIKAKYPKPE